MFHVTEFYVLDSLILYYIYIYIYIYTHTHIKLKRKRGWQRMSWLDSTANSVDMNLSKFQKIVEDREAWHAAVHDFTKSLTQVSD